MVQAISRMEMVLCFLLVYMIFKKSLGDAVQILKFCVETPPAGTNGVNGLMSDMIDAVCSACHGISNAKNHISVQL